MTTEQYVMAASGPQEAMPTEREEQATIKTEETDFPDLESGTRAKGPERAPHVLQAGSIREFLHRASGKQFTQIPGEGLLQQWESQWQEFLETLESQSSGWGSPPLPPECTPWDDAKAFLASFEQVAEACRWPREEWVARLLPSFSKEVEQAFNSLEAGDREDYGKVKAAILQGDAHSRERKRQQFRRFSYQQAKGPRGVYSRLQELCSQWLKVERHSKEQILEQLILEQFLTVLPPEMQSWVRDHGPETCAQAVALAEDFLLKQLEAEGQEQQGPTEANVNLPKEEALERGVVCGEPSWEISDGNDAMVLLGEPVVGNPVPEDKKTHHPPERSLRVEPKRSLLQRTEQESSQHDKQREASASSNGPTRRTISPKKKVVRKLNKSQPGTPKAKREATSPNGKSFHLKPTQSVQPAPRPYKCSDCGKSFCQRSYLYHHFRIHTGERPHKCSYCEKAFREQSHVIKHERLHTGEKPYKCKDCDKSFRQSCNLQKHLKMHVGAPIYKCADCGKSFSQRSKFYQHRKVHARGKSYSCTRCGESFTQVSLLYEHRRCHSAEQAYKCPSCGKSFDHRSSFLKHKVTHTGEKPHKCSICGKSFSQSSNLRKHQKIHTGEKPYKCLTCGKSFTQSSHLSFHKNTHRGFKSYKCLDCGDSFTDRSHLMKHKLTHASTKASTSA
ncbi:zinc finger and SCAN domain-containing protein 12-like [Rhineura floridana]|uniref:zinc finger and SCAN domain-containing protein 12-like n=1 Tax=Rhineura floridana TaxID=261503 RepID=UPI002AC7E7CC|nr:zinc finger and SCAN domain-containing protein 12-like [Rhineura floridana]